MEPKTQQQDIELRCYSLLCKYIYRHPFFGVCYIVMCNTVKAILNPGLYSPYSSPGTGWVGQKLIR